MNNNNNNNNSIELPVLAKGFVKLVDKMGDDASIVQAARVSYGAGTKTVRDDTKLIRFLMKHEHMTPFEMVQFKFHVKLPIFVARQWMRHRTGSYNEISARYSIIPNDYHTPELQKQSETNKQASTAVDDADDARKAFGFYDKVKVACERSFQAYEEFLRVGVSREVARGVLPVLTYTEFYWSVNLRNLLHFIHLRIKSNAQQEIREYAKAISEILKLIVPISYKAFEDYSLNSKTLSHQDLLILKHLLHKYKVPFPDRDLLISDGVISDEYSIREWQELTVFPQNG